MNIFNFVYNIKKLKTEKRCGGSSLNDIYFNEIKVFELLPSCKSVNSLHYYYHNLTPNILDEQKQFNREKRAVQEKIAVEVFVRGDHSVFQR